LILSVGCGGNVKYLNVTIGDVNIDLEIPVRKIDNFVRADACLLPFRDRSFDKLLAIHILEHLEDPRTFLREGLRVCRGKIRIVAPNYLTWSAYHDKTHRWVFVKGKILRITPSLKFIASITVRFRHFRLFLQRYFQKKLEDIVIELCVTGENG